MNTKSKLFRITLPLAILLVGAAGMALLIMNRPVPSKEIRQEGGMLVQVQSVASQNRRVTVHATGTVQAGQQATIVPQVSGRVVQVAPQLAAGGFFRRGELLFRIEDLDYRLAVERARAAVIKAEYDLAREESNARVARQEWERLKLENAGEPNPLVLNEPQLRRARADLEAARAALAQAGLDLERTAVQAPFNCIVRSEEIDLGQYVRAGNGVALVSGTDRAEVIVPLPLEEVAWLAVPSPAANGPGAAAVISLSLNGRTFQWEGRVVRSLGDIEPASRMARVVVAVADPYDLAGRRPAGRPALAPGLFVEVALEGEPLGEIVTIPRSALRDHHTVWLMDEEGRLRFRRIEVLRLEREEVLVRSGLAPGDRLVLTNLSGAAEGLRLRLAAEAPAS